MSVIIIFALFVFLLGWGMLIFLPTVDPGLTGPGFYKLILSVVLGLCSMALLTLLVFAHSLSEWRFAGLLACGILLLLMLFFQVKDHYTKKFITVFLMLHFLFAVTFLSFIPSLFSVKEKIYLFLASLLLGNVTFTMLLGHYYLVVPKLTVAPLIKNLYLFWTLLSAQLLLVLSSSHISSLWLEIFHIFMGLEVGHDIFLLVIFLFQQLSLYIVLPLLSYFTYKLCLMRSTQSATGILYVMVFFVLISEMLDIYFLFFQKWMV